MKLELKHLAPYLPYGLRIARSNFNYVDMKEDFSELIELTSIKIKNWAGEDTVNPTSGSILLKDVKPILRPLSTLKDCPHLFYYNALPSYLEDIVDGRQEFNISNCPYSIMSLLFERHFDVFSLIPAGLAIDINELELTKL